MAGLIHRSRGVLAAWGVALLAFPTPARAEPLAEEELRRLAKEMAAMIADDRYEEAQAILDEYELENPDPFVYLHARLEERRGDCETATRLYERYLDLDVLHADAAAARDGIERCRREPVAPVVASPPVDPDPARTAPAVDAEARPADVAPRVEWWRDPLGDALFFGGVGVGITAAVLGGLAVRERRAANRTPSLMDHEGHADRHQHLQIAGIVVGSVGIALAVGGIVRWATLAQRGRPEPVQARSGPSRAKFSTSRRARIALDPTGRVAIFF